jgi:flagellar motor switch/type III secretory pathway protein FliN
MRDVLALEPGDVVLLPGKARQSLDLTVGKRTVAAGVLSGSRGRYALQITAGPSKK